MSATCRDCGQRHQTGFDGLLCDFRLGGEPRLRDVLRRTGVAPDVAERVVLEVLAADGGLVATEMAEVSADDVDVFIGDPVLVVRDEGDQRSTES